MLGRFCAVLCAGSLTNIIQVACFILQYRAYYDYLGRFQTTQPFERQYLETFSAFSRFNAVKEFFSLSPAFMLHRLLLHAATACVGSCIPQLLQPGSRFISG